MPSVRVRCDGRTHYISESTLEDWLPAFTYLIWWRSSFDANHLAQRVRDLLGNHPSVPIRTHQIYDALHDLFVELSGFDYGALSSRNSRITEPLDKFLRDGRACRDLGGLYRSRSRFLILCAAAHEARSIRLASALSDFIESKARGIVEEEDCYFLCEWTLGVDTLKGLLSAWEVQRLQDKLRDGDRDLVSERGVMPAHYRYPRRTHHRKVYPVVPDMAWDPRGFSTPRRHRSYEDLPRVTWPNVHHTFAPVHHHNIHFTSTPGTAPAKSNFNWFNATTPFNAANAIHTANPFQTTANTAPQMNTQTSKGLMDHFQQQEGLDNGHNQMQEGMKKVDKNWDKVFGPK